MRRTKRVSNKITLHPIMSFIALILFIIVLSGVLNLFDISSSYNRVTSNGGYESVLVSVESLFNLSGLKFIFSNTVSNFAAFTPLSMLLITLIGVGIMDKSGFLDSFFYILTKRVSKRVVTFSLGFLCIISSIIGDLSFITLIPLAALLFKYGKRNPKAGIICAFASITCGIGINIFLSSIDSTILSYTLLGARVLTSGYVIHTHAYLLVMLVTTVVMALIVTSITEKQIIPKVGSYIFEDEEEDYLTNREKKGLIISGFCGIIYTLIFVYNIIPGLPLGGNLLDNSQTLYIDKLFGYNSFFNMGFVFVIVFLFIILGLSYGIVTKSIKNHRDMCDHFSHSLDGVGKVIVLIFMSSMLIFIFKKTNIGIVIVSALSNLINNTGFTGIPLILLTLFVSAFSTLLVPGSANKWMILSGVIVPVFMNAGMSPEFATVVFRAGECITYGLTPLMAYFIIYVAFIELYSQEQKETIWANIKYILPYAGYTALLWLVILIAFYVIGLPLGINSFPAL